MTGVKAIIAAMESSKTWLESFVSDFTDADLLVRPCPDANHAAWQIGNVIGGDPFLVKAELPDAVFPELPAGFAELHSGKGAKIDADPGFLTKAGYLKLLGEVRAAAIAGGDRTIRGAIRVDAGLADAAVRLASDLRFAAAAREHHGRRHGHGRGEQPQCSQRKLSHERDPPRWRAQRVNT